MLDGIGDQAQLIHYGPRRQRLKIQTEMRGQPLLYVLQLGVLGRLHRETTIPAYHGELLFREM